MENTSKLYLHIIIGSVCENMNKSTILLNPAIRIVNRSFCFASRSICIIIKEMNYKIVVSTYRTPRVDRLVLFYENFHFVLGIAQY